MKQELLYLARNGVFVYGGSLSASIACTEEIIKLIMEFAVTVLKQGGQASVVKPLTL